MKLLTGILNRLSFKKLLKLMFSRVVIVGLMILLQFLLLLAAVIKFTEYSYIFYLAGCICSIVVLCHIVSNPDVHVGYKTA